MIGSAWTGERWRATIVGWSALNGSITIVVEDRQRQLFVNAHNDDATNLIERLATSARTPAAVDEILGGYAMRSSGMAAGDTE